MKSQHTSLRIEKNLYEKAKKEGLDLRKLLEQAIEKNLSHCPTCGQKITKPRPKSK